MNLQRKMWQMDAMCQPKEDSKNTHVLCLVSFEILRKSDNRFFWVLRFLNSWLVEMPKVKISEVTFRDLIS
jgi:hypothetical protein